MKIVITLIAFLIFSSDAFAQTLEDRIKILEETLKKQEQTIQELKGLQDTLKKQEQICSGTYFGFHPNHFLNGLP